jgi:hypothetical protein
MTAHRLCVALSAAASLVPVLGVAFPASASGQTVCNVYLEPNDPNGTSGGCHWGEGAADLAARRAEGEENAKRPRARRWVKIGLDCEAGLEICAFADKLWWWGKAGRCDGDTRYKDRYIGDRWNDRVIGARGLGGCNRFIHFEHSGFDGDWISCGHSLDFYEDPPRSIACNTLSYMSRETSSEKWRHCPDRNRLCFRGR